MNLVEVKPTQVPLLLTPFYASRRDARELERTGLIRYDEDKEEYEHTSEGEAVVESLREKHRMTWEGGAPGGGRWVVAGRQLHCGESLEIMLDDGRWRSVRFEVQYSGTAEAQTTGGRLPVICIGLAGGESLTCRFNAKTTLFRLPKN